MNIPDTYGAEEELDWALPARPAPGPIRPAKPVHTKMKQKII